jgi:hypothetical protein
VLLISLICPKPLTNVISRRLTPALKSLNLAALSQKKLDIWKPMRNSKRQTQKSPPGNRQAENIFLVELQSKNLPHSKYFIFRVRIIKKICIFARAFCPFVWQGTVRGQRGGCKAEVRNPKKQPCRGQRAVRALKGRFTLDSRTNKKVGSATAAGQLQLYRLMT